MKEEYSKNKMSIEHSMPFKAKLVTNEFEKENKNVSQLEGNLEVVIRRDGLNYYSGEHRSSLTLAEKIEYNKKARKLFLELKEEYGLKIPDIKYVVGQDEKGQETIFTITQKVHGDNLSDLLHEYRASLVEHQLASLIEELIRYLKDLSVNGGEYLSDLYSSSQYKYGTIDKQEGEAQLYLVDIEPFIKQLDFNDKSSRLDQELTSLRAFILESYGSKNEVPASIKNEFDGLVKQAGRFLTNSNRYIL